jgi:hypothetical protein
MNSELFATVSEAIAMADRWRWEYNTPGRNRSSRCVPPWRKHNELLNYQALSLRLDQ